MIIPLGNNVWYAVNDERLGKSISIIRDDTETENRLFHICERYDQNTPPGEIYLTGRIIFDNLLGYYLCTDCKEEMNAKDVLSDGLGSGYEYEA